MSGTEQARCIKVLQIPTNSYFLFFSYSILWPFSPLHLHLIFNLSLECEGKSCSTLKPTSLYFDCKVQPALNYNQLACMCLHAWDWAHICFHSPQQSSHWEDFFIVCLLTYLEQLQNTLLQRDWQKKLALPPQCPHQQSKLCL